MSHFEAKLQFEHDVLLDDSFFNDYIQCRISGKHIRTLTVGADSEELDKEDKLALGSRPLHSCLFVVASVIVEHGPSSGPAL